METKTAPYGKTVELECKTDLEPPVSYTWKKQSGLLPKDAYTKEVSCQSDFLKSFSLLTNILFYINY